MGTAARTVAALLLLAPVGGCGARTGTIDDDVDASTPEPRPERCNRLDDDLDGEVDEDFRPPDADGLYVDDAHCGACDRPCGPAVAPGVGATSCRRIDGVPTCAATACEDGFAPSTTGRCVPFPGRFCLPCLDDGDCGDLAGAVCGDVGGEPRCTLACEGAGDCPDGTRCTAEGFCAPPSGGCDCGPGDDYVVACVLEDPAGAACVGTARCADGRLSACTGFTEACNGVDDDCDGDVDEGFVDGRGAYTVDPRHCGACGVSCAASSVPEGDLVCGGDPFAPSCVLDCPDARDGIDPGDRVDGDRDVATGCECTVSALRDAPGPVDAEGEALDVNCDGADGDVTRSLYVASDGADGNPGSPTRPLRTLAAAVERAAASVGTEAPRVDVFVAGGVYGETLVLPDGVRVHGGYRRDFLALDPDGFRTELRAPSDTVAPGGAALVVDGAGATTTVLEWVFLVGVDAQQAGAPAFGAVLVDPGPRLALRDATVVTGLPRAGAPGADGRRGADPTAAATAGGAPRGAVEDDDDACVASDARNRVAGGSGGVSRCGADDVGGGRGGAATCPGGLFPPSAQGPGQDGRGPSGGATPGAGGAGGFDVVGPISGSSCPSSVCCGLADFTVPSGFRGPEPGEPGADGAAGTVGRGCVDPRGRFDGERWVAGTANAGGVGRPGAGGGGGGAGGGARIDAVEGVCAFVDGLGGGGGGGGAGGCGGTPGAAGTSGGAAIGILVRATGGRLSAVPTLRGLRIVTAAGGPGGDGGDGGEGGRGGAGRAGGTVPRAERTTPTLAGPAAGAPGGDGGDGGDGGGGGGGCGGPSVGIWVAGDPDAADRVASWSDDNDFLLGGGGDPGRGGSDAPDGAAGPALEVLVR